MALTPRLPLKHRRRIIGSALLPIFLIGVLALYRPAFLTRLDSAVYDVLLRAAPVNPPGERVVIVDVDERSLAAIGQWPWRRTIVGDLLNRVRELGAATVALDKVVPLTLPGADAQRHLVLLKTA